uniref:Reverse transcriptase domain-containing protein n=1 Tax=Tanacetum cinerariifolium TaxID=118510 RepID=A0A699GVM1_TANCI|nr:hypothetical protein [Tanacetum cinerariifolium]
MRDKSKEENVNYDYCEIETKNIELEKSVVKLLSENECLCKEINHMKQDNPSVPLPPPEPPDAEFDFKPDSKEEIPVVMNDKDEFNDDYSSFMFVIRSKMFLSFLSAENKDTIFDPGFTPRRLKFFCSDICPGPKDLHILSLRLVWGNPYP